MKSKIQIYKSNFKKKLRMCSWRGLMFLLQKYKKISSSSSSSNSKKFLVPRLTHSSTCIKKQRSVLSLSLSL